MQRYISFGTSKFPMENYQLLTKRCSASRPTPTAPLPQQPLPLPLPEEGGGGAVGCPCLYGMEQYEWKAEPVCRCWWWDKDFLIRNVRKDGNVWNFPQGHFTSVPLQPNHHLSFFCGVVPYQNHLYLIWCGYGYVHGIPHKICKEFHIILSSLMGENHIFCFLVFCH